MIGRRAGVLAPLLPLLACPALWRLQLTGRLSFRRAFLLELAYLTAAAALLALRDRRPHRGRAPRAAAGIVAGALLLGGVTRLALWPEFPPDDELWEEVQTMRVAADSLAEGALDPWFPLTDLAAEAGLLAGGASLAAVRRPFAVLSVASTGLFAAAAWNCFRSPWPAAVAAALFASLAILAAGGRIALETHSGVFTLSLALAATAWACRRRGPAQGAAAGIAAGLVALEYDSFRPFILLLGLWLLAACAEAGDGAAAGGGRRLAALRRHWPAVALFALFATLVLVPVGLVDPGRPWFFLTGAVERHQQDMAAEGARPLAAWLAASAEKIARHLAMWLWRGHATDLLPVEMAIVGPAAGGAALAGLAVALAGARRRAFDLFLASAVLTEVIAGAVLVQFPARYRLVPVAVLSCLAAGRAAEALLAWRRRWPRAVTVALAALLVVPPAWEIGRLAKAVRDEHVLGEFYSIDFILAREIAALQRRSPALPVLLFSDRAHLGVRNDFSVVYDPARVEVVPPGAAVPPGEAFVLAHDEHIARARAAAGIGRCREWETRFHRNRLFACRRVPPPPAPAAPSRG